MSRAASNVERAWRIGRLAMLGLAGLVFVVNIGVLVVVVLTSLSDTDYVVFPPQGLTLRWYRALGSFRESIFLSVRVAAVAATLAAVLGSLASVALVRGNPRFKRGILNLLLSPLIIPSSVFALAVLILIVRAGWRPSFWTLSLALAVHGAPFCIRIILSGLQNIDWELEAAARTLGASRWATWFRVLLPMVAPSVAAGWVFSFIFAFDDSTISIFLSRRPTQTYGAQLLSEMEFILTPKVAAAGAAIIGITILGVGVLSLIVAMQRRLLGGVTTPLGDLRARPAPAAGVPSG